MTGATADRRSRVATPATAVVLGGLVLVLLVATVPLGLLAHLRISSGGGSLFLAPLFGVVGFVVAWRKPRNPLGWVAVLLQPSWAPAIAMFGLSVLLYPDGRLPSRRWRWLLGSYLAVAGLWIAGTVIISAGAIINHRIRLDSSGDLQALDHPAGSSAWWGSVQRVFFPVLGACLLASVAGLAVSYRRSSGERRLQLKWLLGGAAIAAAGALAGVPFSDSPDRVLQVAGGIGIVCVLALPLSMGVAILKYRLYDIDRIISRTLGYALVTGLLAGVYAGLVLLATQVLRFSSPVAVDLDSVRADLLATLSASLQPAHVSVWLREGSR